MPVIFKFSALLVSLGLTGFLLFAQGEKYPFPQHVVYSKGVIKPDQVSQQQLDDGVRSFYNAWKERYINDDAGKGQFYIWFETSKKKKCVSEGQGYGMVIVALMAGYDTTAQSIYDGLFRYYKAHPSKRSPFLMAWAQTHAFRNIDGSSAADGDIDIAYSLLLADAQWGSSGRINYFAEARSMIHAIMKQEINPRTFSVMPSNAIEKESKDYFDMRSSDFMPANFKAFSAITNDTLWNNVINSNYKLFSFLQSKYSADAGLLPDFIQHINSNPVPSRPHYLESKYDGFYNYNACRVPWRIAVDFILEGDTRSKAIVEKINKWLRETTENDPENISAGYSLAGDDMRSRNFQAMSFTGSFAVSAMVDSSNQAWLNKLWDYIITSSLDHSDYYDNTLKMLDIIILSGNYWAPPDGRSHKGRPYHLQ